MTAFSRVLWTIALCFSKKVTPSTTIFWNIWKWDKDKPHKKYMRWISILVAACIMFKNVLIYRCFLCCTRFFTRLRPGSKQTTILEKAELILDPCERYKFWCSCKKTSLVKTYSQLSCWSRVYSCSFIKSRLHHRGFSTGILQDSSSCKFSCGISLSFNF